MDFDPQKISALKELLESSSKVAITCHLGPDGDALGSSLAMGLLLKQMGKDARVITPDEPPHYLRIFPQSRSIMAFSSMGTVVERFLNTADVVLCMDYNAPYRVSRLQDLLMGISVPRVLIDHHKNPEDFTTLAFSFPEMSSTCELVFWIIRALGWWDNVTTEIASCILGGIITDTGGFHYNSSSPELYAAVGHLLEKGVDKDMLMRALVDTRSESALRFEGFSVDRCLQIFPDQRAALIVHTLEDLNSHAYRKGDTEGLVNKPLEIPGIVYSVYLRQEKDYIKVSMRSLGDFPVDLLCKNFYHGGGHLNAAGGEFPGTMEQAIEIFHGFIQDNTQLISQRAIDCADRKLSFQ